MFNSDVVDEEFEDGVTRIQRDNGIRKCYSVDATPENTLEEIQSFFENVAGRYSAKLEITKIDDRLFIEFDRNAMDLSVVRVVGEIMKLPRPTR